MPTVLATYRKNNADELKIEVNEGETLFEAAERHGLSLPHGCLSGSCGACRIEIYDAGENTKQPSFIEQDTVDHIKKSLAQNHQDESYLNKNIRLSCRAKINAPIVFGPIKNE